MSDKVERVIEARCNMCGCLMSVSIETMSNSLVDSYEQRLAEKEVEIATLKLIKELKDGDK